MKIHWFPTQEKSHDVIADLDGSLTNGANTNLGAHYLSAHKNIHNNITYCEKKDDNLWLNTTVCTEKMIPISFSNFIPLENLKNVPL